MSFAEFVLVFAVAYLAMAPVLGVIAWVAWLKRVDRLRPFRRY